VSKKILWDYIDACELVKETEEDIRRLRRKETVHDKVSGSNPEFPYQAQSFSISGVVESRMGSSELERERELLHQRKENAEKIKLKVEEVMERAPARMQRIIRFKILERMKWEEVAVRMGGKCTGESVRKEFDRFFEKK
jgi:hypothetical protein